MAEGIVYVEPPLWVIRQILMRKQGIRLPELKLLDTRKKCEDCKKPMDQSFLREGKWRCKECDDKIWNAGYHERMYGRRALPGMVSTSKDRGYQPITPANTFPGNLNNDMYRFLVGACAESSKMTICRCCRKTMYHGGEEWKEHNTLTEKQFGRSCPVRLIAAYKYLLTKQECVVCNKRTTSSRWGVPLCNAACEYRWKFEQTEWRPLKAVLWPEKVIGEVIL